MRLIPSNGYIYLASPYSHSDPVVREERYQKVLEETAILLSQGVHVYSPIVHCHVLAQKHTLPTDAAFWKSYNFCMIDAAEFLYILMLDGWDTSVGIAGEAKRAIEIARIPVIQYEPKEKRT